MSDGYNDYEFTNHKPARFETLDDVASALGDGGPFNRDDIPETVADVVQRLTDLSESCAVHPHHDGTRNRLAELPQELLNADLADLNYPDTFDEETTERINEGIAELIDEAQIVIDIVNRDRPDDE